jgi:hypothetical protein
MAKAGYRAGGAGKMDLEREGGAMEAPKPAEDHGFIRVAGVGLVYQPKGGGEGKKHPCPDCCFCQFCAETRCVTCKSERKRGKATACGKLSLREQILLYDEVNARAPKAG